MCLYCRGVWHLSLTLTVQNDSLGQRERCVSGLPSKRSQLVQLSGIFLMNSSAVDLHRFPMWLISTYRALNGPWRIYVQVSHHSSLKLQEMGSSWYGTNANNSGCKEKGCTSGMRTSPVPYLDFTHNQRWRQCWNSGSKKSCATGTPMHTAD